MTPGKTANLPEQTGEAKAVHIYETYGEAAMEAAHKEVPDGLVAKVRKSPYGRGYIVRTVPVTFLAELDLKRRFVPPVDYSDL